MTQSMTEDEAKQKWCPATAVRNEYFTGGIITMDEPKNSCIASDCMAWRWKETYTPNRSMMASYPEPSPSGKTEISTTHGHCGMAR